MVDCSITTISRLENGQQCTSVKNLITLAQILQMDVADLFASYKFSESFSFKAEDEQIIELLKQSSPNQKRYFIEHMKWFLDNFSHLQP